MIDDSFPRLAARTMNFQLGLARGFVVSPDGRRVVFLRSLSGTSRSHALWVYDVLERTERLVADPQTLLGADDETLSAHERARRERKRVGTAGVVAFSTDKDVRVAAFALSSRLFVVDLVAGQPVREYRTVASVVDPTLDPTGRYVAYAGDRSVRVVDRESDLDRLLIAPRPEDPPEVVWGLAEFIAGEELDRSHGLWWAPDGESLLVERYDESPVRLWHIADPAYPEREPVRVRYPQAGTPNAVVCLSVVSLAGERVDVDWRSDTELDGHVLEYLAHVEWSTGKPILTVVTRDQRRMEFRELDPTTGRTSILHAFTDQAWVELLPGTPRRFADGRLLYSVDEGETRRLWVDGEPVTPSDVLVREVLALDEDTVVAKIIPEVGSVALARLGLDCSLALLSDPAGFAAGAAAGGTVVIAQRSHRSEPRYRRAVKARGHFPTEQAAMKCLFLETRSLDPTGQGRARWTVRWKPALNAFAITFADRWPAAETY
jgi:dipeptidyl-peptidase-4